MSIQTFTPLQLEPGEWTLVAAGSAYKTVGVQIGENGTDICLALATTTPDISSNAYVVLRAQNDRSASFDLASGDNLYARAAFTKTFLRGYRITV
jgi:hypothetical protein